MSDLSPRDLFWPTIAQSEAKARVEAWLATRKGMISLEALSQDDLALRCGTRKVLEWLKDPGFQAWFYERDAFQVKAQALKEHALAVLQELAFDDSGAVAPKDRLKAADMLFTVTGAYPTKTKEVRFLDRDLDAMPDHEVERQLAEKRKQLGLPEGSNG